MNFPPRLQVVRSFCIANLSLTISALLRVRASHSTLRKIHKKKEPIWFPSNKWSERRGSNSRHLPWQGSILPLNYSRNLCDFIIHAQNLISSTILKIYFPFIISTIFLYLIVFILPSSSSITRSCP